MAHRQNGRHTRTRDVSSKRALRCCRRRKERGPGTPSRLRPWCHGQIFCAHDGLRARIPCSWACVARSVTYGRRVKDIASGPRPYRSLLPHSSTPACPVRLLVRGRRRRCKLDIAGIPPSTYACSLPLCPVFHNGLAGLSAAMPYSNLQAHAFSLLRIFCAPLRHLPLPDSYPPSTRDPDATGCRAIDAVPETPHRWCDSTWARGIRVNLRQQGSCRQVGRHYAWLVCIYIPRGVEHGWLVFEQAGVRWMAPRTSSQTSSLSVLMLARME